MKIGIIGSGTVGVTLANALSEIGYHVTVGTNDSTKQSDLEMKLSKGISVASFSKTASSADTIIFCVKGSAAEKVIKNLAEELAGKVVLDTTNPIGDKPPTDGVLNYFTDYNNSLLERLQLSAPKAKLVKAMNSAGANVMVNPKFELKPTMFICGNDTQAKKTASKIVEELGWEVEDLGKAAAARAIEPLCVLWCIPGFLNGEWNHAFKLLKK